KGEQRVDSRCPDGGLTEEYRAVPYLPAVTMSDHEASATTVSADQIISFVDRVAAAFKPRRVVLFGSYARGTPTADSDVDLLITGRRWSMSPLTAAGRIRIAVGVPFPMDLIVRT